MIGIEVKLKPQFIGAPVLRLAPHPLPQNLKRVAEVWMDEFAEHIYQRRPEYRHLSAGDVAAQKQLRARLNCKSFKWFMNKIAWDLPKHYPPVEPPAAAWGEVSGALIPWGPAKGSPEAGRRSGCAWTSECS